MKLITTIRSVYGQLVGDKKPELYALRALGLIMIVIRHAWVYAGFPVLVLALLGITTDISGFLRASVLGTTFIFVLAGYFNHLPYERAHANGTPPPPTLPLLKRRLLRIVPVYYVCVVAGIILSGGIVWLSLPNAVPETLMVFGFVHSFLAAPQHDLIGANWAVQAVVQFTVLTPVLSRLLTHKTWPLSAAILYVGIIAYRAYLTQAGLPNHFMEHQLWPRLDHFLTGMLIAKMVVYMRQRECAARVGQVGGVIALALGAVALVLMAAPDSLQPQISVTWLLGRMLFAIACGCCILYLLLTPRGVAYRIAARPVFIAIGMMGYSIFMWHLLLFRAFSNAEWFLALSGSERFIFNLTAGVALMLICSIASFLLLEMPFLLGKAKALQRSMSKARQAAGVAR